MKAGSRVPIEVRLERWKLIDPATGCWEWQGYIGSTGYGRIYIERACRYVHRVAWQHYTGETIPNGLQVDHLCRNRRCFNPEHLEIVTPAENTRRGARASVTHCPSGHEYSGANLRLNTDRHGVTRRYCIACTNRRNAEARARTSLA